MSDFCAAWALSEIAVIPKRKCEIIPESMMDTVIGVSGSSPAYAYLFIEAMAYPVISAHMPVGRKLRHCAAHAVLGLPPLLWWSLQESIRRP